MPQKVTLQRKTHLRLTQSRPLSNLDDNDDYYYVDDDVTFGRNLKSKDFGKLVHEQDIELSDHVKFRLWLARQLALKKYEETWA